MPSRYFTLATLLFAGTISAMHFSKYDTAQCSGMSTGGNYIYPNSGCQKKGSERTIVVNALEGDEADQSMFAVFFKSDDCNPDTIIGKIDSMADGGYSCTSTIEHGDRKVWEYGSWEVWDMCEGKAGCELGWVNFLIRGALSSSSWNWDSRSFNIKWHVLSISQSFELYQVLPVMYTQSMSFVRYDICLVSVLRIFDRLSDPVRNWKK
ncbi:hypothetical protein GQ43DRAFT_432248 [Delitschia confertaspora ATCC 74209]|uniref:Uncharacterized protein n=1 Tax=Delitschia confertaspora ATCC 74209 TaxID=1513339 RepID=A0A9P4JPJ4_9PLEO|nr:hypothetical protein GQ43DRAFT_432248 [Delitschia confertaspora ATCC 74209]